MQDFEIWLDTDVAPREYKVRGDGYGFDEAGRLRVYRGDHTVFIGANVVVVLMKDASGPAPAEYKTLTDWQVSPISNEMPMTFGSNRNTQRPPTVR